jgi:Ser/Thr protein kinase RdoA (MazF antagonist)
MTILRAPIAVGFTAEIYPWHDGQVLKLFKAGKSRRTVEYEANLTRLVHATGLPVPAVGEIIEIDGRCGLELERVEGTSMVQAITHEPWRFAYYAHMLAELQADMHRHHMAGPPSQRERLAEKITRATLLPEEVRQAALRKLETLPEEDKLCHGDFHPDNILLTAHGPVIIDWIDATRGSPLLDVARSTLLFGGGPLPPGVPRAWLIQILQKRLYNLYLTRYLQLNPVGRQELAEWLPVVAAGRLDENIHFDEQRLLSIAGKLLE